MDIETVKIYNLQSDDFDRIIGLLPKPYFVDMLIITAKNVSKEVKETYNYESIENQVKSWLNNTSECDVIPKIQCSVARLENASNKEVFRLYDCSKNSYYNNSHTPVRYLLDKAFWGFIGYPDMGRAQLTTDSMILQYISDEKSSYYDKRPVQIVELLSNLDLDIEKESDRDMWIIRDH